MKSIYMDNAASTKVNPHVLAKFNEIAEIYYANPSSIHTAGLNAMNIISDTKDIIASKLSCKQDEIFFTSGATMSNNILIQGVLRKRPETMFITSCVEHNDIAELYDWLPYSKCMCNVYTDGIINTDSLYETLSMCRANLQSFLVSVQMANSETGVIQPIKFIGDIVHKLGGYLHVDATQYIPYYPINMEEMNIDALSMSGQKIGGLKGSGLLVVRQTLQDKITPIIFGEQGLVGGTYPTPLIASLGEAFKNINYDITELKHKTDILKESLTQLGGQLVGSTDSRLPNNIYIRFPGISGLTLQSLLNDQNIYIGTGSACSSESDKPSHVALAYGLTDKEALECIRFTLSNENTYEEIEYVTKVLRAILELI